MFPFLGLSMSEYIVHKTTQLTSLLNVVTWTIGLQGLSAQVSVHDLAFIFALQAQSQRLN